MKFSPPTDLRGIMLYLWKIIDNPRILKDTLNNFIAFDLSLTTLNKAKKMVEQAIKQGYLLEDSTLEYVKLNDNLEKEFIQWQNSGKLKVKEIQKILDTTWRPKTKISVNQHYLALLVDLIDPSIYDQATKLRSSAIKILQNDFDTEISGKIKENHGEGDAQIYPFEINIKKKELNHTCPDFINIRSKKKKFCSHLGRLIIKLYAKEPEQTVALLKNIVYNREKWQFRISH